MLMDLVLKGSTSRGVLLRIIDSTDGTPETAVVFNTAGIDLWYRREGAAVVAIVEVTLAALTTAWASGGFLAMSHGYYRLDAPDAAFATGANFVDFGGTVTGMVVIGGRVRLTDFNLETATVTLASATHTGAVIPTVTTLTNLPAITANWLTAAGIAADAITDAKVAADVTIASVSGAVGSVTGAVGSVTGAVGSVTGAVGSVTGNVGGSVASVAAAGLTAASFAADAITAAKVAADVGVEIATAVWAELAASHVVSGSFGQRLGVIRAGTAQAGAATTITLDAGASAVTDFYKNVFVFVTAGTGVGQSRTITAYNGTTKVATVAAWATTPDVTSVFVLLPFGAVAEVGSVTGAVGSVTAGVTVTTNNDKTGYAIGTGGIAAAAYAVGANDAAALATDAATEIANAVLSAATTTPIASNIIKVNSTTLTGNGGVTPWGPI